MIVGAIMEYATNTLHWLYSLVVVERIDVVELGVLVWDQRAFL